MILRVAAIVLSLVSAAWAEPVSVADIRVKDGDTIYYRNVEYRMIGYDSPETKSVRWRKVSADERALGEISKARLDELLKSASQIDLSEVQCSCSVEKLATGICNHKRKCGILSVDGENVGKFLIAEELAVPYFCERTRCPKCLIGQG